MQGWIGGFLVISSMGLMSAPALANCETSSASTLTCNSARNTEVDWNLFDSIAGLFDAETYAGCGVSGDYSEPQDTWIFTCPRDGEVTVTISNLECDLDLFVLDDSCDNGSNSSCLGASVRGSTAPDAVTFNCQTGQVYYFGVERVEANLTPGWLGGDCQVYADHSYRIEVDCREECNDLFDNDGDGLIDCLDPDCPVCDEDCDDGIDNDFDNLVDCEDSDCASEPTCCDRDLDNFFAAGGICNGDDCNDDPANGGALVNPLQPEIVADGIDSNCDGYEDCYQDADGDFYGVPNIEPSQVFSCLGPGVANNDDDCSDVDPLINPGMPELVSDGVDSDCDGFELCYGDFDGDSYGTSDTVESTDVECRDGGVANNQDDCDDENFFINPGRPEALASGVDENCDGYEDCYEDIDGDGYGVTTIIQTANLECIGFGVSIRNDDCDDTLGTGAVIFPGAVEGIADGIDQDCDGFEDCWVDFDHDDFGNDRNDFGPIPDLTCDNTDGFASNNNDCNDEDPNTYPGATDPPGDGIDQDCNGYQDCYQDLDGDGWGSAVIVESGAAGCVGVGVAPFSGDCDDGNNGINPDAIEVPNDNVDGDCDGFEDCYQDLDGDTFGSRVIQTSADLTCTEAGVSNNDDDCDDTSASAASINPDAVEIVNSGADEDCDGRELCFVDSDNDGWGTPTTVESISFSCDIAGVADNDEDCDDGPNGFTINPSASEQPADNLDQNCDLLEDCYLDFDEDTFGVPVIVQSTSITCNLPGVSVRQDDCDDNNDEIYPGAPQGPLGGVDYDCSDDVQCFQDADFDGFGSNVVVSSNDPTCSSPGLSVNSDDCNDIIANGGQDIFPGQAEIPNNAVDENCDGLEDCYQDLDNDGYGTINIQPTPDLTCTSVDGVANNDLDCNDNPNDNGFNINPTAEEVPASGVDENCDGLEICYIDNDRDGYGHPTQVTGPLTDLTCTMSNSYADNNDDCDDGQSQRNPGAADLPANGIDEDCDGVDLCFQDLDGDQFGSSIRVPGADLTCITEGVSPIGTDCYDLPPNGASINPDADEIAGNGIDDDCDGDEACYRDQDEDGYGGSTIVESEDLLCREDDNGNAVSPNNLDCNDSPFSNGAAFNPDVPEIVGDGVDQNCDGLEDCYLDQDRDSYGSTQIVTSSSMSCLEDGVAANDDDCYDVPPEGATIYPNAPEVAGNGVDEDCDGLEDCYVDIDRDGYGRNTLTTSPFLDCGSPDVSPSNDDCDDTPGNGAPINPGALEIPADGVDQDCDGMEACYQDVDGDQYGRTTTVNDLDFTCTTPGLSGNDEDCNDILPGGNFIYPNAPEVPGNGIDEDCNGAEDCFQDLDGDGYGVSTQTVETTSFDCDAPQASSVDGDCADTNPDVHPGMDEVVGDDIDQNCDLVDDCYQDIDQDGYGSDVVIRGVDLTCDEPQSSRDAGDCLDVGTILGVRAVDVNPAALEICNNVDDDCDLLIDDEDDTLSSQYTWFLDEDGDGYGDDNVFLAGCDPIDGYSDDDGDCDDSDPAINPDAQEVCDPNGVDEDCDGAANTDDSDVQGTITYYPDNDGDTYGSDDPALAIQDCDIPANYSEDNSDCDDTSALANPSLDEVIYDGLDNDCDPNTPDDDLDGDTYDHTVDCNDVPNSGELVNPGALEGTVPNGIDDNCDGIVDNGTTGYDNDGDGYSADGGDCNDGLDDVHPGADELGNSIDDDCDGITDEGTDRFDDDLDGLSENQGDCNDGDPSVRPGNIEVMDNGIDDDCDGSVDGGTYDPDQDGYSADGGDCDELNAAVFPYAPELADGLDNDCDGVIDEGTANSDDDGDGFSEAQGDCNDDPATGASISPNEQETRNGIDDDCDGLIDEGSPNSDDDGDGFAENQGDCNDEDDSIYPGAEELLNNADDNCDGQIDDGIIDADEDGYTVEEGDCDDQDGWANPGAVEVCDFIDNNCDGQVDEGTECGLELDTGTGDKGGSSCDSRGGSPLPLVMILGTLVMSRRRRAA